LFGVQEPDDVLAELDACHAAYPVHLVRVIGYDPRRQTQGLAFVTHR
jgi:ribulose-bisphosphate carboxylase small chain